MKAITLHFIVILSALQLLSCKTSSNNKDEINKEVIQTLLKANDFFMLNKKVWINDSEKHESNYWTDVLTKKMDSIQLFSQRFINEFNIKNKNRKEQPFGLHFYSCDSLGILLKGLCNPDSTIIEKELAEISGNKYRYTTEFYNVLNDVPIPYQVEGFDWLGERGEKGEEWQFFIIIIKENDKWVIDEIGKIMALPVRKE